MSEVSNEELMEELKQLRKEVRGGNQPSADEQIKPVWDEGPGHPKIRRLLAEVRKGPKWDGVTTREACNLLDRARSRVIDIFQEIDEESRRYTAKKKNGSWNLFQSY